MRARSRFVAFAAAGGALGLSILGMVATADVSAAGPGGSVPHAAAPAAAPASGLPTCPPTNLPTSTKPADVGVTYSSGSFAPVTAAPSYGAGVVFTNREDRTLVVARTQSPTWALTIAPGARGRLALPSTGPTGLHYTGDVGPGLLEASEHANGEVLAPASPPPPSTVTACVVSTGSPSPSRTPTRTPTRTPSRTPSRSASRSASGSPRASASRSPRASASSTAGPVVAIPPGGLPSEQPSLAPVQSAVKPSIAPEPTSAVPTDNAAPSSIPPSSAPPVVDLSQPVPARHRGLPITIGIVLIAGVGSAVARAIRGLRTS